MIAGKKVVWLGFMLLLVSAMLTPQMAAAQEVAQASPQAAFGQTLPDSALQDLSGKDSSCFSNTLSDFQTENYHYYQINQANTALDPSAYDRQTNSLLITKNHKKIIDSTQNGAQGDPLPGGGFVQSGKLNSNTFGLVTGLTSK
jgi:hypothetical protein